MQLREADYTKPETLARAFAGAEKVLLISSSEIGQRFAQHQHVIDAAVGANVKLLVYTSILRADTSTLSLATEHLATEKAIQASGLPFVILRNGWYLENHTESLAPALQYGAILGAAKEGKFASAARADYAAAVVLTSQGHKNKVYELAGDKSFTLSELAAEVAKITVVYQDLPQEEYEKALLKFGLPMPIAAMLADSDVGAAKGALDSQSGDLRSLIGRPTTALIEATDRLCKACNDSCDR
ncbi:MAG: NmrA family protein [Acidobacteriaceae bacterium]|nr:NmrA family protein [Acidobacteriaceae bacterium]